VVRSWSQCLLVIPATSVDVHTAVFTSEVLRLSSQLVDVFQVEQGIKKKQEAGIFLSITQNQRVISCALKAKVNAHTKDLQPRGKKDWKLSTLAASKCPLEKYTFFHIYKKCCYLVLSLDGLDIPSNVLLVFHICECVNMLDECMSGCVSICPNVCACVRLYSFIISSSLNDSLSYKLNFLSTLFAILPVLQYILLYLLIPKLSVYTC